VRAEIGRLPVGVVEDVAPAVEAAFDVIRGLGGRAEPEVVVETFRNGLRLPARFRAWKTVGCRGRPHAADLADPPVAHQLARPAHTRTGAELGAGLEHAVVLADRLDHLASLVDGQRQGFLAIDILARLHGRDGNQGVPVIGDDDRHGVDVRPCEQFAEVLVGVDAFAPAAGNLRRGGRDGTGLGLL